VSKYSPQPLPPLQNFLLKLLLTGLGLYLVYRKINLNVAYQVFMGINPFWLLMAFFCYLVSQIISAYRFNVYLRAVGSEIDQLANVKLYFLGTFYNLFVPTGVGGDGYRLYRIARLRMANKRSLLQALLIDRFNGLAALATWLLMFWTVWNPWPWPVSILLALGAFFSYPLFYYWVHQSFPLFRNATWEGGFFSMLVQGAQALCSVCILYSFGFEGNVLPYMALFLLSSLAAVLPASIGGLGARELIFLYTAPVVGASSTMGALIGILFFACTMAGASLGALVNGEKLFSKK
jgi:glycosyltransferase 2 family protein